MSAVVFPTRAQFQIQALRTINVGTEATTKIFGAAANQKLSGNGTAATFDVTPANLRARAIATGDVNGDGIADIVVGAPEATFIVTPPGETRTGAGVVYIVFGKTGLSGVIDTGAGQADLQILGGHTGDKLGFSVAVGDVNGDGIDDIVMGATGADFLGATPRIDTGAVFVIFGAATLGTPDSIDLATANAADVALFGVNSGDQFGTAVAAANVGGLVSQSDEQKAVKDIFVGAPGNDGPSDARTDAGAAYAQYGGTILNRVAGATTVIDFAVTPANVIIIGKTGDAVGASVAIGDVNGGGAADLIVGAPLADRPDTAGVPSAVDTGAVFVVFGGSNLTPAMGTSKTFDINSTQQNVSLYGAGNTATPGTNDADHLGVSVAAGDVTGDGIPDLLAGAPDADGPGEGRPGAGEAYVLLGGPGLNAEFGSEKRIDLFSGSATVTILGAHSGDHLGSTVAAGNYNTPENSDVIPDLIAASPGASSATGTVSIVFGGPNLLVVSSRDLSLNQDDLRIIGEASGNELGWAIATGDVNNNQGGELIVGAPFATALTRTQAGIVYILPATAAINQPPTVLVTAPNGGETLQVGEAFDITWTASDPNGDGTIQKFEVRLSTDGGTTFNTIIAPNVAGTARKFTWTVSAGFNTTQGRIRVIAMDDQGATAQDASDANFTIADVGVVAKLTFPNGGESLKFGQQVMITWTVPAADAAKVKGFDLSLSTDGGETFPIKIAPSGDPAEPALEAAARTFTWTVPVICTTRARVAVVTTSISNSRTSDASDSDFTISDFGPTIDTSTMFIVDDFRLVLRTTVPAGGTEVVFSQGTLVEISSDAAGTMFFSFSKPDGKIKREGRKYVSKGTINGQDLGVFFPNGATRFIRITKPTCGLTILKVTRSGDSLILAAAAAEDGQVLPQRVWP
ncbi:MAG TPA: hypothetical protein VLM38_06145 [Blastocatellia bacterium]|nr:hypothetical protein [Blastocatellia bacterium]